MTCMLSRLGFVSASKCKRKRIDDTYNKELSWAFGASYMWFAKCNLFPSYFPNGLKETDVPWSWSAGEQRDAIVWCSESPGAILFLGTCAEIQTFPIDCHENEFLFLIILFNSFNCLNMASQTDFWYFWQSESCCLLALSQWKDSASLWG